MKVRESAGMPQRLLYLLPSGDIWGGEVCFLNFVKCLDRTRFEPVAICPEEGTLAAALRKLGVEVTLLGIDRYRRPFNAFDAARPAVFVKLAALILQKKVSIVHSYDVYMKNYANPAAVLGRVPLFYSCHVLHWPRQFRDVQLKIFDALAAGILCVSSSVRDAFLSRNIVDPAKLKIIHPGVDLHRFKNHRAPPLRSELGISANTPLAGIIGRFDTNKNLPGFLEAARIVSHEFPEARFAVVGETKGGATVLGPDLADRVSFLGWREDIPEILSGLDVVVSTSFEEGFGMTLVEAMAASKPVVSTASGGPQDIVAHGQTGLLVAPGDNHAVAEAMIGLLKNRDMSKRMGEAGRERAERLFDIREHTRKVVALYEDALSPEATQGPRP